MLKTLSIVFAAALTGAASAILLAAALASASAVKAAPAQMGVDLPSSLIVQVSGGCRTAASEAARMAALPAPGTVRGAIAATRRFTAGFPTADGSDRGEFVRDA
jgi:hypothetical protein